jgi:hypothetical protein
MINLKNTYYKYLILVFLLFQICKAYSQADDKLGAWYIYNGSYYVDPKVELFFETQLRFYEPLSNVEEFFLRPMANYHFSALIFAGLGYSYGNTWNYAEDKEDKERTTEHRLILQAGFNHKISRTKIQHRYRFEQRWFESGNKHRFRYRLQVTIPINGEKLTKGIFFINVFDEIFINSKPELAFDQNRLYLAGGYQFNKTLNLQIGYLYQSRPTANYNRLQFFLTQKLHFYKK